MRRYLNEIRLKLIAHFELKAIDYYNWLRYNSKGLMMTSLLTDIQKSHGKHYLHSGRVRKNNDKRILHIWCRAYLALQTYLQISCLKCLTPFSTTVPHFKLSEEWQVGRETHTQLFSKTSQKKNKRVKCKNILKRKLF